jgi:hypothetical protein
MTHKALLRQLQISCLGLDHVDPLRLLVDDVIAALRAHAMREVPWLWQELAQGLVKYSDYVAAGLHHNKPAQRTWVGLTDEEENEYNYLGPDMHWVIQEISAILKEKNT